MPIDPVRVVSTQINPFEPASIQRTAPVEIHDCICFEGGCGGFVDRFRDWASWLLRTIFDFFSGRPQMLMGEMLAQHADVEPYDAFDLTLPQLFSNPYLNVKISHSETFTLDDRNAAREAIIQKLTRDLIDLGLDIEDDQLLLSRENREVISDFLSHCQSEVRVDAGLQVVSVGVPDAPRRDVSAYLYIKGDREFTMNCNMETGEGWAPSFGSSSSEPSHMSLSKYFDCNTLTDEISLSDHLYMNPLAGFEISKGEINHDAQIAILNGQSDRLQNPARFDQLQTTLESLFHPVDHQRDEAGALNATATARAVIAFFNSLPESYGSAVYFAFQNALMNFPEEGAANCYQEVRIRVNGVISRLLQQGDVALPAPAGGWEFSYERNRDTVIKCRRQIRLP